jgi:hypothetical protein
MLSSTMPSYIPTAEQENIISIVEKIYQLDDPDEARQICTVYRKQGHEFLRQTYEKYQSSE